MQPKISLYQKNKSKGIKTWYARIKNPGDKNPRYISLGTTSRSEATAILAANMAAGVYSPKSINDITLDECIDKFIENRKINHVKEGSIHNYQTILEIFKPIRNRSLTSLSREEVFATFNEKCEGIAPNTYNHKKTICKSLFSFIYNELEIEYKNPFARIKSKKRIPKFEKGFWTMEQIEKILYNAPTPDDRLFWAFMAYAGLRMTEAINIKRSNIHDGKIHIIGKGDKIASIPICKILQEEIDLFPDEEFNFDKKKIIGTHHAALTKAVKLAGLADDKINANYHRFRHSFGSNLIRAKANVKSVQLLMRHANITTTLNIYGHLLDEDLAEEINLLK